MVENNAFPRLAVIVQEREVHSQVHHAGEQETEHRSRERVEKSAVGLCINCGQLANSVGTGSLIIVTMWQEDGFSRSAGDEEE